MKIKIFIDKEKDEEIHIFAKEKTALIESIERLVLENDAELIGYKDREIIKISLPEVHFFAAEDNKIYAYTQEEKLWVKCRLYNLEERLTDNFIKINKSCIANLKKIKRFDASFGGAMQVTFKNGHTDFVSRRNLKNVKERMGI